MFDGRVLMNGRTWPAVIVLTVALASCSGPLRLLTGSGPNVAANVQAGKTNVQTLGSSRVTEQKIVRPQARSLRQSADENRVSADRVGNMVVQETPAWLIIAFAVALFMDSPLRWPGQILAMFRGKSKMKAEPH